MKTYTIVKTDAAPNWNSVPGLDIDCILWEPDCGVRMTQKLCYDEKYLYVHQQAVEENIRAEYSGPLSPVHEDSCMEFFFAPGQDSRYFNFEINPNACFDIGFGPDRANHIRLCHRAEQELFCAECLRCDGGWTAEYRIPLSFIRIFFPEFSLSSGTRFRANCYKCGDKTAKAHYLSWNPIPLERPNFHCPEYFGEMVLE